MPLNAKLLLGNIFMKSLLIFIFAATALNCLATPHSIDLFNGENLDGWTAFVDGQSNEDSKVFSAKDGFLCVKGNPFGYIRTNKKYSNFKLHVEWRYPQKAVNSGIFLFVQDPMKLWPNAIECQLMKGRVGDFVLLGGSDIAEFKLPGGAPRPKFPVVRRLAESSENPDGEWNCADIICKEGNITLYINGRLQNTGTKSAHKEGYIALQSEGSEVLFRNIRLTPMDD